MAKPDKKKSKSDQSRPRRTEPIAPLTNDPRFSTLHSDPRFSLPKKRDRTVTIDSRFKKVLEDDEFARKAKVDKYGRRLQVDKRREEIRRLYTFEDEDGEEEDEGGVRLDDEEEKVKPGKSKVEKKKKDAILADPSSGSEEEDYDEEEEPPKYDPARGEGLLSGSSSDDSSSDDDDDSVISSEAEEAETAAQEAESIPLGDITSRIAVVNLDWDYVKATDLFVVLSSFIPPGGKILNISIYPSEFGKERMEREEMEGPPREVFGLSDNLKVKKKATSKREEEDDQTEITEQTLIKEDTGEEFDSAALRRYQLERLRYFYAIITCDTPASANAIYTECDGAEYGSTANFFDLRFVPDGTEFEDRPRDECSEMPKRYKPVDFATDALQHSKVKLTWDQEDQTRKAAVKEAFSRREVEEMDLQAYLASDSDEEADEQKEAYRKLLNLGTADDSIGKKGKGEKAPVGDMEVTFSAALTNEDGKKEEIFDRDETTMEKYVRKERERKKVRKEKMKEKREMENGNKKGDMEDDEEPAEDLGFDDPFFENPEKANAESKKQKKQKKREEKERIAIEQASKREELEALMANSEDNLQHFNMNDILKREKLAKLKGKAAKRMAKKRGVKEAEGLQDEYKIDVNDPRFSAIYEKTEFAIDPTNPRYKKTQAMNAVMQERRKRRAGDEGGVGKFKRRK
ncbi:hypothetical protein ABW19_dt0200669 [Dactylella cylindrospora]|nr:hypothetical protein ABW19_dt0200669 [Dactylella cylindrospora]